MVTEDQKKRHVVSYEKMSEELAAAFAEKYPKGYSDYFPDIQKYPKPDGSVFYAVTLETEDAINLVKLAVKTDNPEDIARWLEGEEDAEEAAVTGSGTEGNEDSADVLPDDNISQYAEGDEEPAESSDEI
jgi:hypothetical protein